MASLKSGAVLKGADELAEAFKRLNDKLKKLAPEAVKQLGELIKANAQRRTPVDTGLLHDSAYVDTPKSSESGRYVTIEIGYGRGTRAEQYALIQHETDSYYHRVGEAHYLLNAVNDYRILAPSVIGKVLQEALKGTP